jgi:cobyrinic acid a,c-diamide synthase
MKEDAGNADRIEKAMSYSLSQLDHNLGLVNKSQQFELNNSKKDFERYFEANSDDWTLARINNLISAIEKTKEEKEKDEIKKQHVQSYQLKLIGIARAYNISYQEVLSILSEQAALKHSKATDCA